MPVVIVTGGTFGIGSGISLTLAARGHDVVAFGLDSRQPSSTAENGTQLLRNEAAARNLTLTAMEADVSVAGDVERVVNATLERFGRIDALVNNAAIGPLGTILDHTEELWDRVIEVNVKGTFLCCKAVLPHMIAAGGGSIVNIGSGAGWGKPNMFAYATSKAAVIGLTMSVARDYVSQGIRCSSISPGTVDTPSLHERFAATGDVSAARAAFIARQPMGRLGTADEVAAIAVMLASDEVRFMTGSNIVVDGGMSL